MSPTTNSRMRCVKRAKDRTTTLPESLNVPIQNHMKKVKAFHEKDLFDSKVSKP